MMTDKQKYFHLLGDVCEILRPTAVDDAIRAGSEVPSNLLALVRIGRRHSLPELILLVESSLPDFQIPAQYRPAAVTA